MLEILNQLNNVSTFVLQTPSKYCLKFLITRFRPFSSKGWIDSIPMFQQMRVIFNILKLVRSVLILEFNFFIYLSLMNASQNKRFGKELSILYNIQIDRSVTKTNEKLKNKEELLLLAERSTCV